MRKDNNIVAAYKVVDTCAAEFDAQTPYYYSIQGGVNEVEPQKEKKKIIASIYAQGYTDNTEREEYTHEKDCACFCISQETGAFKPGGNHI